MAQGMKRLGMPIAAFFGVAVIGLIAMSWFLNRDALRLAVEAQIRAVTGLDLVVKGNIDISVFPASYVSFHDVGLKGGATADPAENPCIAVGLGLKLARGWGAARRRGVARTARS